jgi:hypothetical protein
MRKDVVDLVFLASFCLVMSMGFIFALELPTPPSSPAVDTGQQNNTSYYSGKFVNISVDDYENEGQLIDEGNGNGKLKIFLISLIVLVFLAIIVVFFIWFRQRNAYSTSSQNLNSSNAVGLNEKR